MVLAIHTSDSCNTLVSLDNHHNASSKQQDLSRGECGGHCSPSSGPVEYRKTAILLPSNDEDNGLDLSSSSSDCSYCCCDQVQQQPLFLPTSDNGTGISSDEYLKSVPAIRDSCDELLAVDPVLFTEASPEKLLYVHQGEVAHALASQCDILITDRATTCHALALRSFTTAGDQEALTSLTHLDSDQYESSIRAMIQEHKRHHHSSPKKSTIQMDTSIVGGFVDEEGHSQKISNWLLHLLADIAQEEAASMELTLKTCAISSLNDTGFQCPIGRGMAIHLATGQVFLAKASASVVGPQMILRNARLWSAEDEDAAALPQELTVIHTTTSNEIVIEPFAFAAVPGVDKLLALPDDILLEYTSTSPCVEEDDFCPLVRMTLGFLLQVPCTNVFGRLCDRTLRYARRCNTSNEWMLVVA